MCPFCGLESLDHIRDWEIYLCVQCRAQVRQDELDEAYANDYEGEVRSETKVVTRRMW